jgi:hypothetical protein
MVDGKTLDQMVLKLRPEMSIKAVQSRLGEPRLERDLGNEKVLYYGPWLLVFEPGLKIRTRYYLHRHSGLSVKMLAKKISGLPLGTSVEGVMAALGKPEELQIFQNAPHKEESFWFGGGRWELFLTEGKLTEKKRF